MIDRAGKDRAAVLSFGGVLGIGDKLFAVPWKAMTVDTNRHCFVLNVPKNRLKDAPGFDKGQLARHHRCGLGDPDPARSTARRRIGKSF